MSTLHVCLDEAGDLSFTPKGSKYYLFAAAWTYDPYPLARALTDLRYSLLKQGHNLDSFHATEDKQANRDAVVTSLTAHEGWNFAGLVVEKRKLNPSIREPEVFYPKFAGMLLAFVLKGRVKPGASRVLAFTDTLPIKRKRDAVEKAFKETCRKHLPKTPFEMYHHPRQSNCWIQAADYCCWSLQRKCERADLRTYDVLKARLAKSELEVFAHGDGTLYY